MLEFETSESETLLNIEKLSSPFDYTLEIRDGEESCFKKVDLPETFNFLIGLRVQTRKVFWRGTGKNKVKYLVLKGRTNPHATGGEREVVVVWRTTKDWKKADFEADKTFIEENKLNKDADEVFVNCDSFVKNANSLDPVFKRRMFNEE
jgi:adenine-specific DNA-methyltransferase